MDLTKGKTRTVRQEESGPVGATGGGATYYAGLDRSAYPGNTEMQNLKTYTNLVYTGFYLGATDAIPGPCCHPTSSWMPPSSPSSIYNYLKNLGWGFLPLYVGQQYNDAQCPNCNILTEAQGKSDADNASLLISAAGFPTGSVVFLDIEEGGTLTTEFMDYITAWIHEVNANTPYWAGVYCSFYETAQQINNAVGNYNVTVWVFDLNLQSCVENSPFPAPDPGEAYHLALSLQYAQGCAIHDGAGNTISPVDLDSSLYADPSSNPIQ